MVDVRRAIGYGRGFVVCRRNVVSLKLEKLSKNSCIRKETFSREIEKKTPKMPFVCIEPFSAITTY